MKHTNRIPAKIIAAYIEDHLDDFTLSELMTGTQYQKATSQVKIMGAINDADIECCRIIKQKRQMIVLAKTGVDEILLESGKGNIDPTSVEGVFDNISEEAIINSGVLLGWEWFVDASEIHGEYLHTYTSFPIGEATPTGRIKIVNSQGFDKYSQDGYNDTHGDLPIVYYEPLQKRLRFGSKFGKDTFLSFTATLVPSKIDLKRSGCDYDDYVLKSPTFAEEFVTLSALRRLVPLGTKAREAVIGDLQRAKIDLYSHIPQNTSSLEITNGYIG